MVVHKRKKNTRMRGQTTYGYGAKKKHRGAGNRGGKGMAGTGKRADQKKPTILKLYGNAYYGKHGFHRPTAVKRIIHALTLEHLNLHLDKYTTQGLVTKQGDTYIIDLAKLGYQKLLGKGALTHKIKITADAITEKAAAKIQNAGGSIETHGPA